MRYRFNRTLRGVDVPYGTNALTAYLTDDDRIVVEKAKGEVLYDASTSETGATLNDALDYLNNNGGGRLYLASGTYTLEEALNADLTTSKNLVLTGDGYSTVVNKGANGNILTVTLPDNDFDAHFLMENIYLDGKKSAYTGAGVQLQPDSAGHYGCNVTIRDVKIVNAQTSGICFDSIKNTLVEGVTIDGATGNGIYVNTDTFGGSVRNAAIIATRVNGSACNMCINNLYNVSIYDVILEGANTFSIALGGYGGHYTLDNVYIEPAASDSYITSDVPYVTMRNIYLGHPSSGPVAVTNGISLHSHSDWCWLSNIQWDNTGITNELVIDPAVTNVYADEFVQPAEGQLMATGSDTIPNGSTSVNVTHGLIGAPAKVLITPTSSLGAASEIYVSDKDVLGDGTAFQVSVDVDPGADVTFDWAAYVFY